MVARNEQLTRLNDLLCTSFNNVKFDIRQMTGQMDVLRNNLTRLTTDSALTALNDQGSRIQEQTSVLSEQRGLIQTQENAISDLKRELLLVQNQILGLVQFREAKPVVKSAEKTTPAISPKSGSKYDVAPGEVRITATQFRSKKGDINGEWIEIAGYDVDMSGFMLHDKGKKHIFSFPDGFKIYGPVKVFTGKGKDTNTKLFWKRARPIWNDDYDEATLRNKKGRVLSKVKSEAVHNFVVMK